MFDTYRIMSARLKPELEKFSLEELCEMYGKSQNNAEKNAIYRTMYCRLFPMMLSVQKNYPMLSNAQRVEVTMMILISTLRCYNNQTKKKSKFSTYYCTNLKNGMMTQINSLHCVKRCAWLNVLEDEAKTNYVLSSIKCKDVEDTNNYFLENLTASTMLSGLEKEYINCVLAGYTKPEEIEKQLKLKHRCNTYNTMINSNIKNKNKHNPILDDRNAINLVKKLKKSIKQKIEKYDRKIFS